MDEASDIVKGVCTANSNCISLVLLPQQNASIESSAITAHRRALEDRLSNLGMTLIELIPTIQFQCNAQSFFASHPVAASRHSRSNGACPPRTLECYEMGLYFKDSGHGGDRRKRSQPCGMAVKVVPANFIPISCLFCSGSCWASPWFHYQAWQQCHQFIGPLLDLQSRKHCLACLAQYPEPELWTFGVTTWTGPQMRLSVSAPQV